MRGYRERFEVGPLPRVAVYAGAGASHSWTWFADLLERLGLYDVEFLDEGDVLGEGLGAFDALLVGGGDTYQVAGALGPVGARRIEGFVREGGRYFGSCAGAYLVLSGVDLPPFDAFDLVGGDMTNVMKDPPAPLCLEHKYLAPYGDRWVFHPVYGEVEIADRADPRGTGAGGGATVRTVLFGGPVLEAGGASRVVADYRSLTTRAAYMWPRKAAEDAVLGKPAVLEDALGEGVAMASGPHLEHPLFPAANGIVARFLAAGNRRSSTSSGTAESDRADARARRACVVMDMKRALSNARIVGYGLEKMPVSWKIGVKVWEPEKIRMFLDCAWRRLPWIDEAFRPGEEEMPGAGLSVRELAGLAERYRGVAPGLKDLKEKVEAGEDTAREAGSILSELKTLTAEFLSLYFRLRLARRPGGRAGVSTG